MTPASNFRYLMRRTRHSFTWANFERRSTKIRRPSQRSSDDGALWSPQRVMSWPVGGELPVRRQLVFGTDRGNAAARRDDQAR
jgi:hypothetical protein